MFVHSGYESIHALPARWRTKTLWRAGGAAEFDSRLGRTAVRGWLCPDSWRRVTVAETRPFPVFLLIARKETATGLWSSVRARHNGSDGSQKNGRTCGEIGASAQLSGHPERRKPSGVARAHGEGARIRRAAGSEPRRQLKACGNRRKRAAGYYADRMRRSERATVPSGRASAGWWAGGEEECTSQASPPFI